MRGLIQLIILIAILGLGVWAYKTETITDPNDQWWTAINAKLPDKMRIWACGEVNKRVSGTTAPVGCEDAWH